MVEQTKNNIDAPKYVKQLRLSKKLTTKQVSQKVGISQSHISGWENGKKTMANATLQKILKFLSDNQEEFKTHSKNLEGENFQDTIQIIPDKTLDVKAALSQSDKLHYNGVELDNRDIEILNNLAKTLAESK